MTIQKKESALLGEWTNLKDWRDLGKNFGVKSR